MPVSYRANIVDVVVSGFLVFVFFFVSWCSVCCPSDGDLSIFILGRETRCFETAYCKKQESAPFDDEASARMARARGAVLGILLDLFKYLSDIRVESQGG